MVELIHQFVHCNHCKQRWPGLRYECPYCNWPRDHTDETPAPTTGMAPQALAAAPPAAEGAGSTQAVFMDPISGQPILPVPQAAKLDPDANVQQINLGTVQAVALQQARAPDTLVVAAEDAPVEQPISESPAPSPADLPTSLAVQSGDGGTGQIGESDDIAKILAEIDATPPGLPLDAFEAPAVRRRSKKA